MYYLERDMPEVVRTENRRNGTDPFPRPTHAHHRINAHAPGRKTHQPKSARAQHGPSFPPAKGGPPCPGRPATNRRNP